MGRIDEKATRRAAHVNETAESEDQTGLDKRVCRRLCHELVIFARSISFTHYLQTEERHM
eukprot:2786275-Pleurochrysis_carterae.AAC.1